MINNKRKVKKLKKSIKKEFEILIDDIVKSNIINTSNGTLLTIRRYKFSDKFDSKMVVMKNGAWSLGLYLENFYSCTRGYYELFNSEPLVHFKMELKEFLKDIKCEKELSELFDLLHKG